MVGIFKKSGFKPLVAYVLGAFLFAGCSSGILHLGQARDVAIPAPPLSLLWQQKMDAPPMGPALFAGALTLQLSTGGTLYAFDSFSGERVGKRGYDEAVCGEPALNGDVILTSLLGEDAALVALDRRTQKEQWRYEGAYCLSTIAAGDTVIIAGQSGGLR